MLKIQEQGGTGTLIQNKLHKNYCKSSKETRGSYSFSEGPNAGLIRIWVFLPIVFKFAAGLIRIWVLFEGGSLSRIYGMSFEFAALLLA